MINKHNEMILNELNSINSICLYVSNTKEYIYELKNLGICQPLIVRSKKELRILSEKKKIK